MSGPFPLSYHSSLNGEQLFAMLDGRYSPPVSLADHYQVLRGKASKPTPAPSLQSVVERAERQGVRRFASEPLKRRPAEQKVERLFSVEDSLEGAAKAEELFLVDQGGVTSSEGCTQDPFSTRKKKDHSHLLTPLIEEVTTVASSLWQHRLFRYYVDQLFPDDSKLNVIGYLCQPDQVPRVAVPLASHLARMPLAKMMAWMVEGRYESFRSCVLASGVSEEVQKELLEVGEEYWRGGDEIALTQGFHEALCGTKAEQMRCLTRQKQVLFKRNEQGSVEQVGRNLSMVRDFLRIIHELIVREMDERARYQIDELQEANQQSLPLDLTKKADVFIPRYESGTLGHKLEVLIYKIAQRVQKELSKDFWERFLVKQVSDLERDQGISTYLDPLAKDPGLFGQMAEDFVSAGLAPTRKFCARSLEGILIQVLKHDVSPMIEELMCTLNFALGYYFAAHEKVHEEELKDHEPSDVLSVLSQLAKWRDSEDRGRALHPCVEVSLDEERIRRNDRRYVQQHLLPRLKELVFPHSNLVRELIQAFMVADESWEDTADLEPLSREKVQALFEGVDQTLMASIVPILVKKIHIYTEPKALFVLLTQFVEGAWKKQIEECEDRAKQEVLREEFKRYQRGKGFIAGEPTFRAYLQAKYALNYAIRLFAPNPPGIPHGVVQAIIKGAVGQLLRLARCQPVLKSLLYFSLDTVMDHLIQEPGEAAADLSKPIRQVRRKQGEEALDRETIEEVAKLLIRFVELGSRHLPPEASWADWITSGALKFALSWFKGQATGMVSSRLEEAWKEQFSLTFPGVLAVLLDKLKVWVAEEEGGLNQALQEKTQSFVSG